MSDEKKETFSKFADMVMATKAAKAAKKAAAKKEQAASGKSNLPKQHGPTAHGSLNTKPFVPRMVNRTKKGG